MKIRYPSWTKTVLLATVFVSVFIFACGGDEDATAVPAQPATAQSAQAASTAQSAATAQAAAPAQAAATAEAAATAQSAATAKPAPTALPPKGGGHLSIGVGAVCPPIFNNRFLTGACFERVQMWGFTEGITWMEYAPVPVQVNQEDVGKSMLDSWEIDASANTMTWVIKTGIPFHDERWGNVTAEDVAFSFSEAMAEGSTFMLP